MKQVLTGMVCLFLSIQVYAQADLITEANLFFDPIIPEQDLSEDKVDEVFEGKVYIHLSKGVAGAAIDIQIVREDDDHEMYSDRFKINEITLAQNDGLLSYDIGILDHLKDYILKIQLIGSGGVVLASLESKTEEATH